MKAVKPCPQLMRVPRDAAHLRRHLRDCEACRARVGLLKPACHDPAFGLWASESLGEPDVAPALSAHLARCLACRLERLGFASLDEHAAAPRAAWLARLSALQSLGRHAARFDAETGADG